jgi:hypothetical protein
MKQVIRLAASATVDDVLTVLEADGAVIISQLASNETMDLIESELDPIGPTSPTVTRSSSVFARSGQHA